MTHRFGIATVVLALAMLLGSGCSLLPGQAPTMEVDGITVTCRVTNSSIQGADTLGPGPEAQTLCRSRAREAVGTILASQPGAEIESIDVAANGAVSACYTAVGVRTCTNVLPQMPTL
jgi:hypothetical protein